LFKNDPIIVKKLTSLTAIYLTVPVIAELLYGAENSVRKEENLKNYNEFIDECNILPLTRKTAEQYSKIRMKLKQLGNPIPENDIWVAAACIENQMPLISEDKHFDFIENLIIKKW